MIDECDLYDIVDFDPDIVCRMIENADPVADALTWMSSNHDC